MSKKDRQRALVPRLRFPEFQQSPAWETRPGDQLFDSINNKASVEGLPILAITQEHGAIPRGAIDYHVSVSNKNVENYKEVCAGDFVISLRSFQGGIEYSSYHGICSPAYVVLRQKFEGPSDFFKHYFKSVRFIRQLTRNLEGLRDGKMISYRQFSEQNLLFPDSREQQRIADCLGSLDDWIAAEGRKLVALRDHKKGLMQQLFPREGENVPRLRFPEFRDRRPWEERQVGDVFKVTRGQVLAMPLVQDSKTAEAPYPVYSSRTQGNGLSGYYNEYLFEDAITWTTDGANAGDVNFRQGKFYCTNVCGVLISEEGIANKCIAALLNNITRKHVSYVGNPKLMNGVMAKIVIPFPELDEQRRIADCLSSLDDLIAAQETKFEALKQHKLGLMQQLFPAPEEVAA